MPAELTVAVLPARQAADTVVEHHYLHRRPPISYAYGLFDGGEVFGELVGAVTFGIPASRHLQKSACPTSPDTVIELNRLWVHDRMPANTESWFVSRAMKQLPPRIVVSYADTSWGHQGYVYRALNFAYAGWTDMHRKTPRYDYVPAKADAHSREAFRTGYKDRVRRKPKVKYWRTTGTPAQRRRLAKLCAWPSLDWNELPPPHGDSG